ncbi:NTP-binding protein [Lactobacillus johnsonii]|uniref:NTP-binding protein n=1 Tax=Lactobacillus johnsonii TaxID=33959 RepID=A0AAX0PUL6_LACJH|nr:AAA family ATPase [Lactobacillus johnsonii]PAB52584.1 NTP-binding protein [Lactobacillus johnsonii]
MIQLPKVATLKPKSQPHNFFIWGETMSGKSYFSSYFPNPLVLNTDGNSEQGQAPSIQIRNIRDANGKLQQSAIKQLDDIITALQVENPKRPPKEQFQTIVIDVIDDICVMIEQAICINEGVQALSDIPWSKGYAMFNSALQQFVMDLKALPMNVIYISREISITDEKSNITTYKQSLKDKYYNVINGNCDLVIRTSKVGAGQNIHYMREVKAARTKYLPENITNKRVLDLLLTCQGMFSDEVLKQYKESKKKESK